MEYIQLLLGFIVLLFSGHYLVKGSVLLAKYFKISTLVIGVTVVSLGTSAPELFVSLKAALFNHPEISIGNVVGSNIANIALVLGLTAIFNPIQVKKSSIVIDWPIMMASGILFYIFILNNKLQFYEGIIFLTIIFIYVFWSIQNSRKKEKEANNNQIVKTSSLWMAIVFIVLSSLGLMFSSTWLVNGAKQIALNIGVSERVISISLIAFGTSVPELATSLIAAFKHETDISIGNIIGSNIFNILGILGTTSVVKEIPVNFQEFKTDIFWMLGISLLLFVLIIPLKGGILKRYKGLILFAIYCIYIYSIF
ncbi:MAG: calcium/sodium antiporter [Chlorobi bacterium]|nr:calcium/sodium antiporter [Chlorobiota bacterium]